MNMLHHLADTLTEATVRRASPDAIRAAAAALPLVGEAVETGDPNVSFHARSLNLSKDFALEVAGYCLRMVTKGTTLNGKGQTRWDTAGKAAVAIAAFRNGETPFTFAVTVKPAGAPASKFSVRVEFDSESGDFPKPVEKSFPIAESPASIGAMIIGSDIQRAFSKAVGQQESTHADLGEASVTIIKGSAPVETAYIIANQLCGLDGDSQTGLKRLTTMLGVTNFFLYAFNPNQEGAEKPGLSFKWPNRERSRGNFCVIELRNDEYDIMFYNMSAFDAKLVKTFNGIYAEKLRSVFEGHTGWHTSIR